MVNEIHSVKYCKTMLLYYYFNWDIPLKGLFKKQVHPNPFLPFESKGEHNGIKLTKNLVRTIFVEFMMSQEDFMQKSFQCNHDKEAAGDHTYKYLKLVKAATRGGDVFTASYTTMILLVHVATSHLTFINSNSEIEPIIQQIGEIRKKLQ